jgi:hypothetical protein
MGSQNVHNSPFVIHRSNPFVGMESLQILHLPKDQGWRVQGRIARSPVSGHILILDMDVAGCAFIEGHLQSLAH